MARNIPNLRLDQIQWFEARLTDWSADPASIGLTPGEVADLSALVAEARAAHTQSQEARAASISATQGYYNAAKTMRELGSDLVTKIKLFAELTGNTGVYVAANVSPADPRSPRPAPNAPFDVRWSLSTTGVIELTWKATGNEATYYEVHRKLESEPAFHLIGTAGEKKFEDAAIPAGTPSATYYIRPRRDEKVGEESVQITASFHPIDKATSLSLAA